MSDVGGYSYCTTLSGAERAPDPADPSWRDYTLATAELPDTAYPHGDPSDIALFALNTKDGTLYETTNPNWSSPALATSTPVGSATALCTPSTSSGTPCWKEIAVPWGSTAPSKAQPGVWTNLVAVYNATTKTAQLYVDGTLAGSTIYTAWSATVPFTIGRDKYSGSPADDLAGSIADVQTWNNALPPRRSPPSTADDLVGTVSPLRSE